MKTVVRTWKRDGYRNVMSEDAALANLAHNAIGYPDRMLIAQKCVDVQRRLRAGEVVETLLAAFRMVLAILALLFVFASHAAAQQPEWYWTKISEGEYALWHNAVQVGNYRLSDESYYPRLDKGQWGKPCDCPCYLPPAVEAALASYRAANWKTRGVLMGPLNIRKTDSGLRFHNLPMPKEKKPDVPKKASCVCPDCPPDCNCGCAAPLLSRLSDDVEKIPDYSAMPSLTLVARDEADAHAALEMFETAPELAHWRAKYGDRAKAYSLQEFAHTGYAFKLDQDRQFQDGGFVAMIQPQPPDENGRAEVKSYYTWATPEQALKALRDADPAYDPNPAPAPVKPAAPAVAPAEEPDGTWGKVVYSGGLGASSLLMVLGSILAWLRTVAR